MPPKQTAADKPRDLFAAAFTNAFFGSALAMEDDDDDRKSSAAAVAGGASAASSTESLTVAEALARNDAAFAAYLQRMRDADKSFVSSRREYLNEGRTTSNEYADVAAQLRSELQAGGGDGAATAEALADAVVPPAVDVDGRVVLVRWTHSRWPDLVAREYIAKRRRYGRRILAKTRGAYILAFALVVLLALLYFIWPVWTFLVDVGANEHYKTLELPSTASSAEVKKAYRVLAKRWHPDSNPGCGAPCQAKMREIQHAHDVLLSKGDRAASSEMKRKYQDALEQLMSFVFYRGFTMAFNMATLLAYFESVPSWIARSRSRRLELEDKAALVTKVATILVFMVLTAVYVTGPNVVLFLVSGYSVVHRFQGDAASEREVRGVFDDATARTSGRRDLVKALTLSNYNLPECIGLFVVPAFLLHCAYEYTHTVSANDLNAPSGVPVFDGGKFVFHAIFGIMLVCSHLIHIPPNLFDNIKMMECTIPQTYFRTQRDQATGRIHHSVTKWAFVTTEMGLLIDDVFAFVIQVPAPYRIAVFVCHGLFLVQMFVLPWATPTALANTKSVRLHAKLASMARAASGGAVTSSSASAGGVIDRYASSVNRLYAMINRGGGSDDNSGQPTSSDTPSDPSRRPASGRPLTQAELTLISGADLELVSWQDFEADANSRPGGAPRQGTRAHALRQEMLLTPAGRRFGDVYRMKHVYTTSMIASAAKRLARPVLSVTLLAVIVLSAIVVAGSVRLAESRMPNAAEMQAIAPTRSGYTAQAVINGGSIPAPPSFVGPERATRAVRDLGLTMVGGTAWLLVQDLGDVVMKYSAAAGTGSVKQKAQPQQQQQQQRDAGSRQQKKRGREGSARDRKN
jgi:TRAP-type C4-dicarboxylate transport system permease small subunit